MRTLLLAAILYLIGIIIVLLLRPTLMFNDKGDWKEFGTISPEHTIFPFWLFCIVWAVVSYIVSLFLVGEFKESRKALYEAETPEDLVPVLPSKTKGKNINNNSKISTPYGNMKPGYYMLDAKELKKTGIPKYLYVGEDAEPMPVELED